MARLRTSREDGSWTRSEVRIIEGHLETKNLAAKVKILSIQNNFSTKKHPHTRAHPRHASPTLSITNRDHYQPELVVENIVQSQEHVQVQKTTDSYVPGNIEEQFVLLEQRIQNSGNHRDFEGSQLVPENKIRKMSREEVYLRMSEMVRDLDTHLTVLK